MTAADVVVIGAGPAGMAAAICSGRCGSRRNGGRRRLAARRSVPPPATAAAPSAPGTADHRGRPGASADRAAPEQPCLARRARRRDARPSPPAVRRGPARAHGGSSTGHRDGCARSAAPISRLGSPGGDDGRGRSGDDEGVGRAARAACRGGRHGAVHHRRGRRPQSARGTEVVAVLELRRDVVRAWARSPGGVLAGCMAGKAAEGIGYLRTLRRRRVPVRLGYRITAARPGPGGDVAEVDMVGLGPAPGPRRSRWTPSPSATDSRPRWSCRSPIGCELVRDPADRAEVVRVDDDGQTPVPASSRRRDHRRRWCGSGGRGGKAGRHGRRGRAAAVLAGSFANGC